MAACLEVNNSILHTQYTSQTETQADILRRVVQGKVISKEDPSNENCGKWKLYRKTQL